ncbi:uncharacterized protein AC631_04742 [Debaryomyces fabryi]|uniref:Increased recombination centers protein 6 n=1 Tax=Debaryomyces fabryi TaxID=58627 RepID=A0A0V1PTA8_9ASCO|nr:uncharacterized protein AC631_04742 [Debaryomyces fabryi]KRZ99491.1 hypothetical protein AC631_04742 [Debaryomyces fabryi]CUM54126.1 unnamed protein product [Debaryomyces fabryi]
MIPNHVLVLGAPNTGKIRICELISSRKLDFSSVDSKSHSGLIFKTDLSTKYYSLKLNLLVDEYPQHRDSLECDLEEEEVKINELKAWRKEFLSDGYRELREAIDGLIFCVRIDQVSSKHIEESLHVFSDVRDKLIEDRGDGLFSVVVGNSNTRKINEEVEDLVIPFGFEYINLFEKGEDEFRVKIGQDRLLEIIETNEWSQMDLKKIGDPDAYNAKKRNDMSDMTRGLLNDQEGEEEILSKEIDLEEVLMKVQQAKQDVKDMDDDQKEAYTNKVIKDIIDFI